MNVPLWFIALYFLLEGWPLALAGAVGAAVAACFARDKARVFCLVLAGALTLPPATVALDALARWASARRSEAAYARLHTVLDRDTTSDGVTLPAGMRVRWRDAAHTRLDEAWAPRPVEVFGVPTRWVGRVSVGRVNDGASDGEWMLKPDGPAAVQGWPCAADLVFLRPDGSLVSCTLAEATAWQGWILPAGTSVDPDPLRGKLGLRFYAGSPVAREIGRALPRRATLNADGSLDGAEFDDAAPLGVGDVAFTGEVRWRYDPATFGRGRDRPPVAVAGATARGRVVVSLPDGTPGRE